MSFRVETTARAERDRQKCYDYIFERSPQGAAKWADAYEGTLESIELSPHRGFAPENNFYDDEVRQTLFKTRLGSTYRVIFIIRGETIYILHVRGAGQDVMAREDIELPDGFE